MQFGCRLAAILQYVDDCIGMPAQRLNGKRCGILCSAADHQEIGPLRQDRDQGLIDDRIRPDEDHRPIMPPGLLDREFLDNVFAGELAAQPLDWRQGP